MQNDLITRLRAAAGTDDHNIRNLLREAANELERLEFAGRWSSDCAKQADDARKEAMAEVERLKAQNARLREAIEYSESYLIKNPMNAIAHKSKAHMEMRHALKESPAQSLAEMKASMVDECINFISAMEGNANANGYHLHAQALADAQEQLEDWATEIRDDNKGGGSGYDREVLGQNNEGDTVTV